MRVVHLDTGETWRGGQQQVYLLHRELSRLGVESRVLARGELLARCRSRDLPVEELPGRHPWQPETLARVLEASSGGVLLHAHDSHAAALGAVARRLRPAVRLVCHRRVSYPLGGNPASRWKYRQADAWVAVSEEVAGTLMLARVPDERVAVVHSCLDLVSLRAVAAEADPIAVRAELSIPPGARVIGLCGAFTAQKGHRTLVDAAQILLEEREELVFLLMGEGALRGQIEDRVRTMGIGQMFRFPGFRRDVAALTRTFDVAVVPSVDGEGSSAALKEPLALGIPVVASDLLGNLEVLGGAGRIFPRGDANALAGELATVLDDGMLCRQLAAAGLARVERFRPEVTAEQTLALYRRVAK